MPKSTSVNNLFSIIVSFFVKLYKYLVFHSEFYFYFNLWVLSFL